MQTCILFSEIVAELQSRKKLKIHVIVDVKVDIVLKFLV